jgi:hypothetical protein
MTLLEFVARTFSPRLPDGRLVFRPWGARGPCYLLSDKQRSIRALFQLAFYGLMGSALCANTDIFASASGPLIFFAVFVLLNYALFWIFTIGLPKTDMPLPATSTQRRIALTAHSRALGRPLLWFFAIVSWLFALGGGSMVLFQHEWLAGLLCILFFGASASLFSWQLWLVRDARDD